MLRKLLAENYEVDQAQLVVNIYRSLEEIHQKLEAEITYKQNIIDGCGTEIRILREQVTLKEQIIRDLENRILENQRSIEGNRQLINKLLNDLERRQQDIEWYKRTYENRSFIGTIKEKLFNKLR
jgi:chromosome segregation ATPase